MDHEDKRKLYNQANRRFFIKKNEIFLTHSGPFYPVALSKSQLVPDNIDGPRFDLRTVLGRVFQT